MAFYKEQYNEKFGVWYPQAIVVGKPIETKKIADCLLLSARLDGERVETVEVSLRTFDIVQSRGVCNKNTEYHERIVRLVKENMNLIRQAI